MPHTLKKKSWNPLPESCPHTAKHESSLRHKLRLLKGQPAHVPDEGLSTSCHPTLVKGGELLLPLTRNNGKPAKYPQSSTLAVTPGWSQLPWCASRSMCHEPMAHTTRFKTPGEARLCPLAALQRF